LIDRFHRRLLWPIRDTAVSGRFGARVCSTTQGRGEVPQHPETPHSEEQLLYGVDWLSARSPPARAVIVEGYTT